MLNRIYFAFGMSFRGKGGMNDLLARCETLEDAHQEIEADAAYQGGYYGRYEGHVAIIEGGDIVVVEWYAAKVVGNVEAGRVERQLWSDDPKKLADFMFLMP